MVDLLRYVLTHFWPFIGACVLIGCACSGIAEIIRAFRVTARGGEG